MTGDRFTRNMIGIAAAGVLTIAFAQGKLGRGSPAAASDSMSHFTLLPPLVVRTETYPDVPAAPGKADFDFSLTATGDISLLSGARNLKKVTELAADLRDGLEETLWKMPKDERKDIWVIDAWRPKKVEDGYWEKQEEKYGAEEAARWAARDGKTLHLTRDKEGKKAAKAVDIGARSVRAMKAFFAAAVESGLTCFCHHRSHFALLKSYEKVIRQYGLKPEGCINLPPREIKPGGGNDPSP